MPGKRTAMLTLSLIVAGCASTPPDDAPTTAPHLPFKLSGSGTPTVIFEAGAGEKWQTWDKVLPEISKQTRTFAYTRRGYEGVPALSHRDAVSIVEELRGLLREQHVDPPYLLVGHSSGGLYMQVFAKTHPEEVAGVVLVDTSHPDQFDRMKAEHAGKYWLAETMMKLSVVSTAGAEIRAFSESQKQWHAAGPFPQVPAIVLSAMRDTGMNGKDFTQFIQQLHRELVASWPGAELRMVDSDHFIQRSRPEDVVKAIHDVLDRITTQAATTH